VNYGVDGFYIAKPQNQRQNENTYKIKLHHGHKLNKKAFGNAVTDILGGVQHVYDHWISNSGGAGNLVQRIPAKFTTAEHLIYDDYQIIGPHFRCPPTKPAWMCIFYLIDAYKARKVSKIPSQLRYIVGQAKTALTMWKGILFPRHFFVKDALDVLLDLGRRAGLNLPEFKSENLTRAKPLFPTFAILDYPMDALANIIKGIGFGSTWGFEFGRLANFDSFNIQNMAYDLYDRIGQTLKWNIALW